MGIFPAPLPDETCYSLLCRIAVRHGHITSTQFCESVFGHLEPMNGYLFKPFRMRDIQRWLGDRLFSSGYRFVEDHSCYPYYSAFLKAGDSGRICSCRIGSTLSAGQAKRINRECGFVHHHKRQLWYCPSCVREDFLRYGETCWRRLPQMPGAIYCPIHREAFRPSGVSYREINYQIIPASYALIHVPDPQFEAGTVYAEQYCRLSGDIAWLLDKGFSIPDGEWLTRNFYETAGKPVNTHLLYDVSRSSVRKNRFEDYLTTRIIQDSGKNRIDLTVSRRIGSLLSIEHVFGTMEKFCST